MKEKMVCLYDEVLNVLLLFFFAAVLAQIIINWI